METDEKCKQKCHRPIVIISDILLVISSEHRRNKLFAHKHCLFTTITVKDLVEGNRSPLFNPAGRQFLHAVILVIVWKVAARTLEGLPSLLAPK